MKFLHTSDWHVGKTIRGHSRAQEHKDIFAEIISLADDHKVDFTIVAGDLFETAAPTPESETIVYQTLMQLAEVAPVVAIAGNHDNHRKLQAVTPLLDLAKVTMACQPKSAADGGVITIETASKEKAQLALLPFISQRAIVKAQSLMSQAAFQNAQTYTARLRQVIKALSSTFDSKSVNILVGHCFVTGAVAGGGERPAHLIDEYGVSANDFPTTVTYAALGHLHRPQKIAGPTALHYCGSPLQLDFGEESQTKQVNIVEASPGLPAKVEAVELSSGRRLRTLVGTVESLIEQKKGVADEWLRIRVEEPYRVGLADDVRELFGEAAVEIQITAAEGATKQQTKRRDGRTSIQLFDDYLEEQDLADETLTKEFASLLDEIQTASAEVLQ